MGRKSTQEATSMYNLANRTTEGMEIGDLTVIDMPINLAYFRKYLSEIGRSTRRKFTTISKEDKLHVMRVQYSNIHSKEVQ